MARLERRSRQLQKDRDDIVDRAVDAGRNQEALPRYLARHRHDVGARDIPDIDVVVRLAAIARNDRPLAGFDALVRFDDMQRVHASVMLPLAIDRRIAQRDVLEPVALFVQAQQVLADDLARSV